MPLLAENELYKKIEKVKKEVKIGTLYRHYKNKNRFYKVLLVGITENTHRICIIYQALYNDKLVWVREYDDWKAAFKFEAHFSLRLVGVEQRSLLRFVL